MGGDGEGVCFIDAHCHLQDPRIYGRVHELLEEAKSSGVKGWVCNGTSEEDWDTVLELADRYPAEVLPSFGIHPWMVAGRSPQWLQKLESKLEACPRAAVGEVGLHKGKLKKGAGGAPAPELAGMEEQVQVLRQQLELAQRLRRPVSVHCVNAYGHLQKLLGEVGPFPAGVVLHSFGGSPETIPALASSNAYFSLSGFICTAPPGRAAGILKAVPRERLLLETDCPDATPPAQEGAPLLPVPTDSAAECPEQDKAPPLAQEGAPLLPVPTDSAAECPEEDKDSNFPSHEPSSSKDAPAVPGREGESGAHCAGKDESSQLSDRLDCACGAQGMSGDAGAKEGGGQKGEEAQQQKAPSRPLNHPGNISHVCAFVASNMGLSKEEVGRMAYTNAWRVFAHFV